MKKIKNVNIGKRFLAGILAATMIGCGIGGMKLHKKNEVNRVKGYLSDFLTEENYVDLSKISRLYDVAPFSGEALYEALQSIDVDYVRITDAYIYDDPHVETFTQMNAVNYSNNLGIDQNGNIMYEMYEPTRNVGPKGVIYEIPEGFTLESIEVIAEPIRYNELAGKTIDVINNEYEDSYTLVLNKR